MTNFSNASNAPNAYTGTTFNPSSSTASNIFASGTSVSNGNSSTQLPSHLSFATSQMSTQSSFHAAPHAVQPGLGAMNDTLLAVMHDSAQLAIATQLQALGLGLARCDHATVIAMQPRHNAAQSMLSLTLQGQRHVIAEPHASSLHQAILHYRQLSNEILQRTQDHGAGNPVSTLAPPVAAGLTPPAHFINQQAYADQLFQQGLSCGNVCGVLTLAHMTGTAPDWPGLITVAANRELQRQQASGQQPDRRQVVDAISDAGVSLEDIQAAAALQGMMHLHLHPFMPLPGLWQNQTLDAVLLDVVQNHAGNAIGFRYFTDSGTEHTAALYRDQAGQWWNMDSLLTQPQPINSPVDVLGPHLMASGELELVYVPAQAPATTTVTHQSAAGTTASVQDTDTFINDSGFAPSAGGVS